MFPERRKVPKPDDTSEKLRLPPWDNIRIRDEAVQKGYKPHAVVRHGDSMVELMSWPYWSPDQQDVMIFARLIPGDPTSAENITVSGLGEVVPQ